MSARFSAGSGKASGADPMYQFLFLGHTSLNYVYAEHHHRELLAEAERERQLALVSALRFEWASVFSAVKAGLQALLRSSPAGGRRWRRLSTGSAGRERVRFRRTVEPCVGRHAVPAVPMNGSTRISWNLNPAIPRDSRLSPSVVETRRCRTTMG